jgi:YD repeat-containing protein
VTRRIRGDRLGCWRLQFDAASRKTQRIDGRGSRTSYSYDAASRPTGQQYQDGTRVTSIYDASSQRTVLSDLTGSYTSTYDPDGLVSAVINPAGMQPTLYSDESKARCLSFQPHYARPRLR